MAVNTARKKNFFEGTSAEIDWTTYLHVRPDYTKSSFYDLIYAYHDSHCGTYDVAYDVGCGPGQVTATLASRFKVVHGSDPDSFIVNEARESHKAIPNIDFEVCAAEDLAKPKTGCEGTADMVTVAEAIPIMNADAALAAFATLLQPGGTLAIWFYGGPIFNSPGAAENSEMVKRVQALFRHITSRSLDQVRATVGADLIPAESTLLSWLDNIAFDPASFQDGETVDERGADRTFWEKINVDFAWAKGFIDAQMPRKEAYAVGEVKAMLDELQRLMDGKVWNASWPVVLLLASKV